MSLIVAITYQSIPIRGIRFKGITQGDQDSLEFDLNVDVALPDPNTWTDCRLTITPTDGSTPLVASKAAMTFTPAGIGPWTVTVKVPLTQAQTLALPRGFQPVQFDARASGWSAMLLEGLAEVFAPKKAVEAPG